MNIPFVDLRAQYDTISVEVNAAIQRVLERTDFILGEDVRLFEEEFAQYCNTRYAVGIDSGTSALELGLRSLGIGPGDEVITPAFSFIASAAAISFTGAVPVFVDIEPDTYCISPERIKETITPRTKAIMPVHLYGHPADMDPILDIADEYGIPVIEDACQAHGALYKGSPVGSLGHLAAFSFYPSKNLGAYGDAGMLVTNDLAIAEHVRMMRNYGQTHKYHHEFLAYNRRLDTLQAAVLRVKLNHLDEWNSARRHVAALYTKLLQKAGVVVPYEASYAQHVYHLYVIRVLGADDLRDYLSSRGIATGTHYPIPIHLQGAYRALGHTVGAFPVSEKCAEEVLSLPMYPELTEEQIISITETISDWRKQ